MLSVSIGANIKAKRREVGMKQEELALRLGLTQANVSRIEASVKGPSGELLVQIATALGCDVRELLGIEISDGPVRGLDEDTQVVARGAMRGDPQLAAVLRSVAQDSPRLTDGDWQFLGTSLKLALNYSADLIRQGRLRGEER